MWTDSKRARQRQMAGPTPLSNIKLENPSSSLVEVDLAALSQADGARSNNKGHYLAVRLERSLKAGLSSLPEGALPHKVNETIYAMCVADGREAMPGGEVASGLALRKLIDLVVKTPDWIMRLNRRKAAVVKRRLIQHFRQIDIALREQSDRDPRLAGMGTTLMVACSLGADLFLAHLGDSRAYLLRGDELHHLTRDHTAAPAMSDAGRAGAAAVGVRQTFIATLGSTALPCDPEVQRLYLRHDDQLLLCTGGLSRCVEPETIWSMLRHANSSNEACRDLMNAALSRGGNDNITVVLARYCFPQTALP